MANNKLAIIGGSGLYDVEEFKDRELLDLNTPWGKPSDKILKAIYKNKEVYFLPRHGKGHFISPSNIKTIGCNRYCLCLRSRFFERKFASW